MNLLTSNKGSDLDSIIQPRATLLSFQGFKIVCSWVGKGFSTSSLVELEIFFFVFMNLQISCWRVS